jgi:mRNA degradation ribonuclease J1/J2
MFLTLRADHQCFSIGVGIYDLPKYLTWSGLRRAGDEKPLFLSLTHAHFDHSGEIP